MFEEWNDELRNLLYEGELDTAARSNAVMSLDAIIGAHGESAKEMQGTIDALNVELSDVKAAMTRLALVNSKFVAANAVVAEAVEEVEEVEDLDDDAALSAALDVL